MNPLSKPETEWVLVQVQPMASAPSGEEAMEPSEIDIHEGAWAIVLGTNGKAVGWIDTHAHLAHRIYRDRFLSTQVDGLEVVGYDDCGQSLNFSHCYPDSIRSNPASSGLVPLVRQSDALALQKANEAQREQIQRLTKERDEAQAEAYRSQQQAVVAQQAVSEASERAAKNWRDFRDLRIAITGDGPMCRDCADFDGRCQGDGRPCDPDEAVSEQIATWKAAEARLKQAEDVIRPFAMEGWADENGWTDRGCPNDRVCDWFGPSDFHAARQSLENSNGQ
jgi:hypothetical protein